jgi:tRNA(Ile)-lysidine synthase
MLLVRPLLTWAKRIETESYCRDSVVEYRYDTMNEDTAFKRVRIRKILLPLLEDMNPKIIETLAGTAGLMQQQCDMADAHNIFVTGEGLMLDEIRTLSEGELFDTIRGWLRAQRGTTRRLQLKHIEAIARLVSSTKSGKTAELPGGSVTKSGGRLVYAAHKVEN